MYRLYFGNVLIPVAPDKIKTKIKNQNKTLALVNEGELNILKSPGLTEISFTLLLPHTQYPFAVYENGFKNPTYFLSLFEKLKVDRQPFVFTVLRKLDHGDTLPWKTEMKCALEAYSISESAGGGLDFEAEITLRQYIPYGVKTLTLKQNGTTGGTTATTTGKRDDSTKTQAKTYTIKNGDTLWDIARTQLGDGTRWNALYTLNKKTLDDAAKSRGMPSESGNRYIFTGTVIQLPAK